MIDQVVARLLGDLAQMALTLWLGGIIFFSLVSTPVLLRTLEREEAGRAMRAIFPAYYRLGATCGGVFVAGSLLDAVLSAEPRAWRGMQAILGAVMLALTLYAWRVLLPRIESARVRAEVVDPTDLIGLEMKYFKMLHARSTRFNALVLALGMACLMLALLAR